MTMSEPESAASNANILVFAESSAAKHKSRVNHGKSNITTTDDKIWLNDTGSFGALTQKSSFMTKTLDGHARHSQI